MTVGVLALQGDFEAHAKVLRQLGAQAREIRTADDLDGIEALVIPGGESTTMALGIERENLADPLTDVIKSGIRTLGTCAGMIVLGREHLGLLDVSTRRNAFGRQTRSFETELEIDGKQMTAVFIRAPWVEDVGDGVEVLAEVEGHPVAVRQANVMAVAFHPELTGDAHLHEWVLEA